MGTFKLKGNATDILIVDTDYYKWLLRKQLKDINSITTKVEYLRELGFVVGVDRLTSEDVSTLGYIEKHYLKGN